MKQAVAAMSKVGNRTKVDLNMRSGLCPETGGKSPRRGGPEAVPGIVAEPFDDNESAIRALVCGYVARQESLEVKATRTRFLRIDGRFSRFFKKWRLLVIRAHHG
jgi:hypothetical protein